MLPLLVMEMEKGMEMGRVKAMEMEMVKEMVMVKEVGRHPYVLALQYNEQLSHSPIRSCQTVKRFQLWQHSQH